MSVPSAAAARRAYLLLSATRWFPVGLVVSVTTLLPLERGLGIAETLTLASITGLVVFALELPTGGLADTVGRRPVLVAAATAQVAAAAVFALAPSFWAFALAAVGMGVFRALDSGPLEAWFVDTVHATRPGADVDRTLSHQGVVVGASIGLGALASGGLIWWHPVTAWPALVLPAVLYAVLAVGHLVAVALLVREAPTPVAREGGRLRGAARSVRRVPGTIRDGVALVRDDRVLACLLLVEVFWATAMVVFESLMPVRLGEMLGGGAAAGAVMGPVAAVGWGVFALGAAAGGLAAGRIGAARAALLARVLNGLGAVWMGLAAGPAALVAAYLVTYGLHGSGGPVYNALLHRQATRESRATVLSLASMAGFAAFAVAAPSLGALADGAGTHVAMAVGGAVSVLGAACFVPALRRERAERAAGGAPARV